MALTITGLVDQEQALTMVALKAKDVVTLDLEHPRKGPQATGHSKQVIELNRKM